MPVIVYTLQLFRNGNASNYWCVQIVCGIEGEWWTYVICNDGLIKIIGREAAEQSIWPARRQDWQCQRRVLRLGSEHWAGEHGLLGQKGRLQVCMPCTQLLAKNRSCCSVLNSGCPPGRVTQHEMLCAFSPFSSLIYLYVYQLIHMVSIYLALYPLAPADV